MTNEAGPNVVSDGLALYLDAANSRSYPGSGTTWTNLRDSNNGTLINGVGYSSSNSGTLTFNGTNQYVNCPITKNATCTFSLWAKTSSAISDRMIFNAGPDAVGPDVYFTGGLICWNTWDGASNPFGNIPASATNGNFHNYVIVNNSASVTSLYYDGALLGNATYRNASANTNLTIGGNTNTYMWNGDIANFVLYNNKALTASEVLQNYNATKGRYGL
jgi:hypothetical protein